MFKKKSDNLAPGQTFWQSSPKIVGPAKASEFKDIGQQNTRSAFEDFILGKSSTSTLLLDAGCNTGVEGYRLMAKGFPGFYVGMDSNHKALALALQNVERHRAAFILSSLESISFPDKHFDVVLNKDVIEHAASYEPILLELARVTKTWLVLSMFIKMHDKPDYIYREPEGYHHNRYERKRLYDFMARQGFAAPETIFSEAEDEVLIFRRT